MVRKRLFDNAFLKGGIMGNQVKKWQGQTETCDICQGPLTVGKTFYDARTQQGPWGALCRKCFIIHGVGVGLGKGQEYNSETLEKVRG
jgi:hypothetical protein